MSKGIYFEVSGERGEPKKFEWNETKDSDRDLIKEISNVIFFKLKPIYIGGNTQGYYISNDDMITLLTLLDEGEQK